MVSCCINYDRDWVFSNACHDCLYWGYCSFVFVCCHVLNIRIIELNQQVIKYSWVGALISISFILEVLFAYYYTFGLNAGPKTTTYLNWILYLDTVTNIELLGQLIYTLYSPLFIIASIILLVSMIGLLYLH